MLFSCSNLSLDLTSFFIVGEVLLTNSPNLPHSLRNTWIKITEEDDYISFLDRGAERIVLKNSDIATSIRNQIPNNRLAITVNFCQNKEFYNIIKDLNGFTIILSFDVFNLDDIGFLKEVISQNLMDLEKTNFILDLKDAKLTYELIKQLKENKLEIMIPESQVSKTAESSDDCLTLGEIVTASLKTDRTDGLYTTVVTDESGVALGLVYSSLKSLNESIYSRQGIYQSRNRGLWHKGLTSGATQDLLKLNLDCDGDAIKFTVTQHGSGFCHLNTRTCWGQGYGITHLSQVLRDRMSNSPEGSYTKRLFNDRDLLKSKIIEEAHELCDATSKEDVAWEAADLIYFALARCTAEGVSLSDIEKHLDLRSKKITRRPGNAKPQFIKKAEENVEVPTIPLIKEEIEMCVYDFNILQSDEKKRLLERPIMKTEEVFGKVKPILDDVKKNGDKSLLAFTEKFDQVKLDSPVVLPPFNVPQLKPNVKKAIDVAFSNILKFHSSQLDMSAVLKVETMPGIVCSRFVRPIESVGLYVPGGSAVLPSTALMLGIPAMVAGCKNIVIATPPRKDGTLCPEVVYVAEKVGASVILVAGGAQAIGAMAYGTETVPKVDKICGPGNQFVTAAKMIVQNDTSAMVSIDMPAGPSELLVIADDNCNPAYVVSDLLSQAEHGPDSQVILLGVNLSKSRLAAIQKELDKQAKALERCEIIRKSIAHSHIILFNSKKMAMDFSNTYAPEHLILHVDDAESWVKDVFNAGSVFVGKWAPESCGDYASGTNHTLPTYGYAKIYSGVNTNTFVKHITSQTLTKEGLSNIADTVMDLAEIEGLGAHRNAVAVRVKDLR
ncbi:trifunctional histidinol dehydrogenase [Clydaea vesicula]|uniref:Histidine biosynthesis trifunctional protein n=1 Tax=Clydaea vesicula TaxID=447962 RepID=A0AAD5TXQ4_9FUNG|nr:trifunctional histidinol dehydrogenase [Clydaea vesicula]